MEYEENVKNAKNIESAENVENVCAVIRAGRCMVKQYFDEIIIRERMEEKKGFTDTYTGMYAGARRIEFQEVELFSGEKTLEPVWIRLPTGFTALEQEQAKRKYPSENRPQRIFADEENRVNFTFSAFRQRASQEQLKGTLIRYRALIKKLRQDAEILDTGSYSVEEGCGEWFSFRNDTLDEPVFNLLALMGRKQQLILCMCNCYGEEREDWEPIMHQVIQTIQEGKR